MVKEISGNDFDAMVLKAGRPVLVDFWAPWCGPCRAISPVIEALSGEMGEKLDFYKLNVDDSPSIPGSFGIRSIPTIIVFRKGKVAGQITGNVAKSNLKDMIETALNEEV
ncbi:MAG: thioredoxin [Deltaproteobacteria bacterium]|jgi:thioredoxin 1|nr:thioredoxin [Deltaproteobacteria bacterium]